MVPPRQLVESGGRLRLNGAYYLIKQIMPALERVLSLVGADVRAWFAAMPRSTRMLPQKRPATLAMGVGLAAGVGAVAAADGGRPMHHGAHSAQGVIADYYLSRHCLVCDELTGAAQALCIRCSAEPQASAALLLGRAARLERQHRHTVRLCLHCGGGGGRAVSAHGGGVVCDNLDCGMYYERRKLFFESQVGGCGPCNHIFRGEFF